MNLNTEKEFKKFYEMGKKEGKVINMLIGCMVGVAITTCAMMFYLTNF